MAVLGQARYCQDSDEQHLATLEIGDIAERTPDLHKLYLRWMSTDGGEVPRTTAFDPAASAAAGGWTAELLDTSFEAPEDWPIHRWQGTEWVSGPDDSFLRDCIVRWARRCMISHAPIFQHVDQTIAGQHSEYHRLLLPLRGPATDRIERVLSSMVGERIGVVLQ